MMSDKNSEQVCPFCKKAVDPLRAPAVSVVDGRITHFCSPECRERFLQRSSEPPAPPEPPPPEKETAEIEEPAEEQPAPTKREKRPRTKASGSWQIRNQLIETTSMAAVLALSLFAPNLLGGMLVVGISGAAVLAILVLGVLRDRRLGAKRMFEAAAVPICAALVLACAGFGLNARIAAVAAVTVLLARSLGLLLELMGRRRSGVLFAIEGTSQTPISSSWKDNSKTASGVRRVVLTLEWARYPAAALVGVLVYLLHSRSILEALVSSGAALVALAPRALRMATGDAHLSTGIAAASRGITIRDAHVVEKISRARIALFMTNRSLVGRTISVVDWQTAEEVDENKALKALASVEAKAEGRIAAAIMEFVEAQNTTPTPIEKIEQSDGLGIIGETDLGPAICGSRSLLLQNGISTGLLEDRAETIEKSGRRAVFLALDGYVAAVFGIEETPVSGVQQVTQQLKGMGMEPQMITSAEVNAAQALGQRVGIESVRFLTREEELGSVLSNLLAAGEETVLVGRGAAFEENLMSAAASIALGQDSPTQAGVDAGSADVKIVPWIVKSAKQSGLSVKINLAAAQVSMLIGLAVSSLWLSPFTVAFVAMLSFGASSLTTLNGPYPLIESIWARITKTVKKIKKSITRRWSTDR